MLCGVVLLTVAGQCFEELLVFLAPNVGNMGLSSAGLATDVLVN